MAVFKVTGITHTMFPNLSREEAKEGVRTFLSGMERGKVVKLVEEPDNPADPNAVAVYVDYTRHIGYIKSTECLMVKPLLNAHGQCDAVVSGRVGSCTLVVTIPNTPEVLTIEVEERRRVLPVFPLEGVPRMPFTREEHSLMVVVPDLLELKPAVEDAVRMADLAEKYVPLAGLSICFEDGYWRAQILQRLMDACQLDVPVKLKRRLEGLRDRVHDLEGELTRTVDKPAWRVMEQQLKFLRAREDGQEGLFANFERHLKVSGRGVEEELERLKEWFRAMPALRLQDWENHEQLALGLLYQKVSRKELYEVYASLLILERYGNPDHEMPEVLRSEKAMVYWQKLKEQHFVDDHCQLLPKTTRKEAMYIAAAFAEKLKLKAKWKTFQDFWDIKYLAQEKWDCEETGTPAKRYKELEEIFEG